MFKKDIEHLFIVNRRFTLSTYLLAMPPLGVLGSHRFYLKEYKSAIIMLVIFIFGSFLIGFNESIINWMQGNFLFKELNPEIQNSLIILPFVALTFILFVDLFYIPKLVREYNEELRKQLNENPENIEAQNPENRPPFISIISFSFLFLFLSNYGIIFSVYFELLDMPELKELLLNSEIKYHISNFINYIFILTACWLLFKLKKETMVFFTISGVYSVISTIVVNGEFDIAPIMYIALFMSILGYCYHLKELDILK